MRIPWSSKPNAQDEPASPLLDIRKRFQTLSPFNAALATLFLGSLAATSGFTLYRRFGKRIRSGEWVTPRFLTRKRWIKGVVTSVGDADNFRFFHTPPMSGYTWPLKFRRIPTLKADLKDETLHVRMAGIDAPEAAHFGKPAQKYSEESLHWLRNMILGRKVYIQLLRRDQYSRVVAEVRLPSRCLPGFLYHGRNVSIEMLKAGWATVYEQAGAEYGNLGKVGHLKLEAQAREARRGIWKDGGTIDTPAAYKKRHAAQSLEGGTSAKPPSVLTRKRWWTRLFSSS